MTKNFKKFVCTMVALAVTHTAAAWDRVFPSKITERGKNQQVQILKVVEYTSHNMGPSMSVDLYLDLDGDPKTAEAVAHLPLNCPDKQMDLFNLMNKREGKTTLRDLIHLGEKCGSRCNYDHSIVFFTRSEI